VQNDAGVQVYVSGLKVRSDCEQGLSSAGVEMAIFTTEY